MTAAIVLQVFFASSAVSDIFHAAVGDTDNQFRQPHRTGSTIVPAFAMTYFMVALIAAEVSAFLVVFRATSCKPRIGDSTSLEPSSPRQTCRVAAMHTVIRRSACWS